MQHNCPSFFSNLDTSLFKYIFCYKVINQIDQHREVHCYETSNFSLKPKQCNKNTPSLKEK